MLKYEVNTTDVDRYFSYISTAPKQQESLAFVFVKRLTERGKLIMQQYIKNRSVFGGRGTGSLANSIGTETAYKGRGIEGKIEVGAKKRIPYQRTQEYGIKKRSIITGNMAVNKENWINAKMGKVKIKPRKVKGGGEYYFFYRVKRGKFEGKHYVADTVKDLKSLSNKFLEKYIISGVKRIYIRKV